MTKTRPGRKQSVLLMADDDEDDRLLTEDAFRSAGFEGTFDIVADGKELVDTLAAARVKPDLILLDLNMPRMDGHEALSAIKGNPELCTIPIVILTTSEAEEDVQRTYSHGVNSFITKPSDFDQFVGIADNLQRYWFDTVTLPSEA